MGFRFTNWLENISYSDTMNDRAALDTMDEPINTNNRCGFINNTNDENNINGFSYTVVSVACCFIVYGIVNYCKLL